MQNAQTTTKNKLLYLLCFYFKITNLKKKVFWFSDDTHWYSVFITGSVLREGSILWSGIEPRLFEGKAGILLAVLALALKAFS